MKINFKFKKAAISLVAIIIGTCIVSGLATGVLTTVSSSAKEVMVNETTTTLSTVQSLGENLREDKPINDSSENIEDDDIPIVNPEECFHENRSDDGTTCIDCGTVLYKNPFFGKTYNMRGTTLYSDRDGNIHSIDASGTETIIPYAYIYWISDTQFNLPGFEGLLFEISEDKNIIYMIEITDEAEYKVIAAIAGNCQHFYDCCGNSESGHSYWVDYDATNLNDVKIYCYHCNERIPDLTVYKDGVLYVKGGELWSLVDMWCADASLFVGNNWAEYGWLENGYYAHIVDKKAAEITIEPIINGIQVFGVTNIYTYSDNDGYMEKYWLNGRYENLEKINIPCSATKSQFSFNSDIYHPEIEYYHVSNCDCA